MMMESMGPTIIGFYLEAFLMLVAGIFYILCAGIIWKSYKKDGNELVGALLAFLVYQAVNMFFMGLEIHTMNMLYGNISALSVFIGSAYMLKFPFSSFSRGTRKSLFFLVLIVVLGVFAWFMQTEARQITLMHFTLWYDMVVNGIVVGGFMFLLAIRTTESRLRVKALGGSSGVVSCCVVSNGAMLGGAIMTSAFFGFLAPVVILASLLATKRSY